MRKLLLVWAILCLCTTLSFAQSKLVTGKVTDQQGQPVPFATIHVKGTKRAVSADADGAFSIKVDAAETLVITGAGINEKDVLVGPESSVSVTVTRKSANLTEVVVTALGLTSQKDKLAVSQSTIKGTAIQESGEVSLLNGLASKASGVQVQSSGGDPGASVYIQIRGQSTITNDLQPLFVVDGVPVYNDAMGMTVGGTTQQSRMNDINPDDIASVEVLKSTAAAALYGTRAANGVILITTKKGKASAGKINVSLATTYSTDVLDKSVPLQTTFGQGDGGLYVYGTSLSWGDKISDRAGGADVNTPGAHVVFADGSTRYATASGTTANPHGGKNSRDVFDHSKEEFHNGNYLDNTLSFSGGDDKTVFYASASNLDQNGIFVKGSDYHRKAFNFNLEKKLSQIVKIVTNFNYSNVQSERAQQGSNLSGVFLGGLRTSPDFDNSPYIGTYVDANGALYPLRQVAYRNPIGASTLSHYDNPLWNLNWNTSTTEVNRALGSFELNVAATPWLTLISRTGVDFYDDNRTDNYPVLSSAFPGGSLTMQTISALQFNEDLMARVTAPLSKNINLIGILGANYNNRNFENVGVTVGEFILPNAPLNLQNSAGSDRSPFNSNSVTRMTAGYFQLSLDAYDQLFLNVTGRAENANSFANTFYYPSAALGWQFTKLRGLDNSKFLSFGKLRVSAGQVGVQPPVYQTATFYNPASNAVLTESYGSSIDASAAIYGGGYLRSQTEGNPNIKPETKTEYEGGADLRFFNNRISLSGTYYSNKTTGALLPVQVPATTGYTNQYSNAGTIQNRGVEADLGITWYKSSNGNLSISSNFTWSTNKNKVISLGGVQQVSLDGFTSVVSSAVVGHALGEFWGAGYARDAKGNFVFDANGFPTESTSSSALGDPNPDWIGGVSNTIRFKSFNFSFLFDHVQGGQVWNGTRGGLDYFGTAKEVGNIVTAPTALKDYNGNTIAAGTQFRGNVVNYGAGNVAATEPWYQDIGGGFGSAMGPQFFESATRTRLREIALGYSLTGPAFRQKTKLQSIDFSLTGRNIVLWSTYKGIDPETNLTGPTNGRGIDYFNNPSTRSYLFTIKINY